MAKKAIAIIGASGNMGSAIAKSLAKGNYRLLLFSSDTDKLNTLVEEIKKANSNADIDCFGCPFDASWEADIIIPAIPFNAQEEMAENIRQVSTGKIVISIANPLNESFDGLITAPDTSAAEELQKLLPYSKVVKAFNTTFAGDFSQLLIDGKRADAFVAGNDEEAVQTVEEMVRIVGFNPIVAGKLSVSRILENMQLLLIQLNRKYNYKSIAAWKILH
jgi:8-hydroxy-5-deazaflavin:NADPH oxidoreductase